MKAIAFSNLIHDMKLHNIEKEHYSFIYNHFTFDAKEKIYFCGWNDHITDKRKARNFDKTEYYFGPRVANYCRRNNISSLWTADKYRTIHYSDP